VGDIESIPFLEAVRQIRQELGSNRVLNVHLTLVPTLSAAGEQKTKPTQHSVKELMELGIIPDILLCRSANPLTTDLKSKIALFCNVSERNVISAIDVPGSLYEIPYMFHDQEYDSIVLENFKMDAKPLKIPAWDSFRKSLKNPEKDVRIAVVGKYIALQDSYRSIYEAILHGAVANKARLDIVRVDSEDLEKSPEGINDILGGVDGILVPGGFGDRGIEGKVMAISFARKNNTPFFGICLGMQCAAIEFARNV